MRIFWIIAGLVVVFVLLPTAGVGAYFWRFYGPVPQADYPAPKDAADARRQDLDFLLRLPDVDHSFSAEEEARFRAHVAAMTDDADTMSDAAFAMGVAAAVAITQNGHTNVRRRRLVEMLNSLPVRFFWFDDGLYIVRAREEHADLIGLRVLAYDGARPEDLAARLDPYIGGNAPFQRFESPYFFAAPAGMHAVGLAAAPERVTLTLADAAMTTRAVVLDVEEIATAPMAVSDHALATASAQETESGHAWRFLNADAISGAHYARNPERILWSAPLPDGGFYLRLREIGDDPETPLRDWLSDVRRRLRAAPASFLVLDLRSNGGGDLTRTMGFARNITDLVAPEGRIYILTDGGTFSAAIVTAAYALHDAGDRGVVVGRHVGDDERFWAEGGGALQLPNSALRIGIATGYHDWENGCRNFARCYWLSAAMGVAAGPLDPDIDAPLRYADYARGVDTTLQAVLHAEAQR